MKKVRKSLSYANLMASFAVFLALGGTAVAVQQAAKNSVTSKSIKDASVTGKDVKDDSLTGADVDEGTLAGVRPGGPAGGDLSGTYPNPALGPDSVGTDEIAAGGVTNTDIGEGAVTGIKLGLSSVDTSKIQNDAVQTQDIADGQVNALDLGLDSVGADEFKGMSTTTSAGVTVNAGTPKTVIATCPAGRQIVSGGYAWQEDEANSIIYSVPSETLPNSTWEVRGAVDAGSNTLFAWALCMQA